MQVNMRHEAVSLWERREELPVLPLPGALVSTLILCLIAALTACCGAWAFLSAIAGGAILAALFLLHRSVLTVLTPLCTAAIAMLCADSTLSAISALLILPLGAAIAIAVYRGWGRLAASVLAAACGGSFLAVPGVILLRLRALSVSDAISLLRTRTAAQLAALTVPVESGERMAVFSAESAEILTNYLLPFLPAITVLTLLLTGCTVSALVYLILSGLGARADFFPGGWRFYANRAIAVIFCGAQLCVFLAATTPQAQPMYYASVNLALIFMMPLAGEGAFTLIRQLRTNDAIGTTTKIAVAVLTLMLLSTGLYWFCTAAALYGVYTVFRRTRGN